MQTSSEQNGQHTQVLLDRLTGLQTLTVSLSEAVTSEKVAEAVLSQTASVLGACAGVVARLRDDGAALVCLYAVGYSPEAPAAWSFFPADARTPLSDAVRDRRPVFLENLAERDAGYPKIAGSSGLETEGALAALPLIVQGQAIGGMSLQLPTDRAFSEQDQVYLLTVAGLCAQALDRARLHDAEKAARERAERAENDRRQSEERLRAILDNSPSIIFVKDGEGRYLLANRACQSYSGDPSEKMLGKTDRDYLPPEFADRFRTDDLRVLQTGQVVRYEEEAPCHGEVRPYLTVKSPLRDTSGQPYAVCGIATDITDLKRADQALRQSEERLRTLSNNLPHGAIYQVVADAHGGRRFLHISAGVERLFGVSPAEAMADATVLYGLIHEEDVPRVAAAEEAALRNQSLYDCEFRSRTRNGDLRWLHCRSAPRHLPSGEVAWEGVLLDVTDRKNAETELARLASESEKRRRLYEAALSNTPDLAYVFDLEHRFTFANEGLLRLWGKTWDEAIGKTCLELGYEPWHAVMHDREIEQIKATRQPIKGEVPFTGTFGRRIYEYILVPVLGEDGEVEAVAGTTRDVTERRQAEDRYRTVLESITDAFFALDRDWRFTYVNRQAQKLLDRTPGDLLGKNLWEEFGGLAGSAFERVYRRVMAEQVAASVTAFYPDHDRWYEVHVFPAEDGISVYFQDVTARHQAEAELARLHAESDRMRRLYETALSNSPDYNFMFDLEGRFTYANAALLALWGKSAAEAFGKTPLEIGYPPDLADRLLRQVRQVMDTRQPVRDETPFTTATGTREFEYSLVPVVGAGGAVEAVVGSAHDITDRKRAEQRLRESQGREQERAAVLETVLRATPTPIFISYDRECRSMTGNPAAFAAVRTPEGEVVSASAPGDLPTKRVFQEYRDGKPLAPNDLPMQIAAREGIEVRGVELTFVFSDGELGHFYGNAVPLRNNQGEVTGAIAAYVDITGLKRAQTKLQESEERFRATFEQTAVGIMHCDPQSGRFLLVNPAACSMTGYSREELAGKTWQDITHPDDLELDRSLVGQVLRGETPSYRLEKRYLRKDGSLVWVDLFGTFVWDRDGKPKYGVAVLVDISDRKEAEQELKASEGRFRQLAEAMPQIVWVADPLGQITYLNQHWSKLTGGTTEEGLGERWGKFIHPEDLAGVRAIWQSCVRSERDYHAEYRLRGKDGAYRWQVVRGVPIRDEAGQVVRWYGSSTDIDEPKRLAESLREADRRKDDFLATLAHELRNPLAPMRNGLQVMKLAADNAGAVEQARGMIERQMAVMVRLIDDLLDVSRITRGKLPLRKQRLELASVVQSAVEGSRPLLESSAHHFTVSLPLGPIWLNADATRLAQVFANLLNNAAKYTERGGRIALTAERHGSEVVVTVKDTGIGIAAEHLPRLFEMFSQAAPALERSQGGLGIGLSLVKGLVEMHGGSVEGHSEGPGKGSVFVVRLPVADGTSSPETRHPGKDDAAAAQPRRRILVADDNRDAADSLAMMLRLQGHDVEAAHDGEEAVAEAERLRPEVALLDIGMPRLNGYDACRRIREQPWGKRMLLVALTGWGQADDRRRAVEAGFDHHLTKPVDPGALGNLLAALKATGE